MIVVNNHEANRNRHQFYLKRSYFLSGRVAAIYILHIFMDNGGTRSYVIDGYASHGLDDADIAEGFLRAMGNVEVMVGAAVPCLGIGADDAFGVNIQNTIDLRRNPRPPQPYQRFWCMQHLIIRLLVLLLNSDIEIVAVAGNPRTVLDCAQLLQNNRRLRYLQAVCINRAPEAAYYYFAILANAFNFAQIVANTPGEIAAVNFLGQLAWIHAQLFVDFQNPQIWQLLSAYFGAFTTFNAQDARNIILIRQTIEYYIAVHVAVPTSTFQPIIFTTWYSYAIRAIMVGQNAGRQPTILEIGTRMIELSQDGYNAPAFPGFAMGQLLLHPLIINCGRCFTNIGNVKMYALFTQQTLQSPPFVIPNQLFPPLVAGIHGQTAARCDRAYTLLSLMSWTNLNGPNYFLFYPNFQNREIGQIAEIMKALSVLIV